MQAPATPSWAIPSAGANHDETDAAARAEAEAARAAGPTAVICVSETEAERDAGCEAEIAGTQLAVSFLTKRLERVR